MPLIASRPPSLPATPSRNNHCGALCRPTSPSEMPVMNLCESRPAAGDAEGCPGAPRRVGTATERRSNHARDW